MTKYCLLLLITFAITGIHAFSQPVIQSLTPSSGPIGISVTIKGTGFDSIANNNIVFFGAVRATVAAASDSTVDVTVPSGATYQPITVTNTKGTAYSSSPFCVTFGPGVTAFSSSSFLPRI